MRKILLLVAVILVLAGCRPGSGQGNLALRSLGPAPEIENEVWINTEQPLRLEDLRGKVVLLEMWTFG